MDLEVFLGLSVLFGSMAHRSSLSEVACVVLRHFLRLKREVIVSLMLSTSNHRPIWPRSTPSVSLVCRRIDVGCQVEVSAARVLQ